MFSQVKIFFPKLCSASASQSNEKQKNKQQKNKKTNLFYKSMRYFEFKDKLHVGNI